MYAASKSPCLSTCITRIGIVHDLGRPIVGTREAGQRVPKLNSSVMHVLREDWLLMTSCLVPEQKCTNV